MRLHRHKQPYHHHPRQDRTTTITTMLTMQTREPTQTQGVSMEAETPIPTPEQESRILVVILVHPRHMLINTATIKPVLHTLTRTKSTRTRITLYIQPAQAHNQTKSTDIIMDRS